MDGVGRVFLLIVAALFSYLQRVHQIANRHVNTAASIYLLLGLLWFALYNIVEVLFPGSFLEGGSHLTHRRSGLLYFSLATLTTVGYGDIVPADGLARTLAALEAGAGVLYVAITVALLVSAHKERSSNQLSERCGLLTHIAGRRHASSGWRWCSRCSCSTTTPSGNTPTGPLEGLARHEGRHVHAGPLRRGEEERLDGRQHERIWKVIFPFENR